MATRKHANLAKGAKSSCDGTLTDKRQPPEWFALLVQDLHAGLQEQVRTALRPTHLLFLLAPT